MKEIRITANDAGRRLDRFLRKYLKEASLGEIYKFIRKDVKVDGKRRSESYILNEGETLSLYLSDDALDMLSGNRFRINDADNHSGPESQGCHSNQGKRIKRTFDSASSVRRNFDLVYEDDYILVANKPYGLLTHGDSHEKKDHLANRVKDYLIACGVYNPRVEKVFTPAPVNRLDRNTTGIVLFGKTAEAMRELTRMIREDEIRKYYLTIACGEITKELYLSGLLVKDETRNKVRILRNSTSQSKDSNQSERVQRAEESSENAKNIETIVRPLEVMTFGDNFKATLCEVELLTGRSHQIRAHLAATGHPLIGDIKYALRKNKDVNNFIRGKAKLNTQLLHAYKVEFSEYVKESDSLGYLSGKTFDSTLPKHFREICSVLGASVITEKSILGSLQIKSFMNI